MKKNKGKHKDKGKYKHKGIYKYKANTRTTDRPVMGLAQAAHLFEKSSPKHSAQYGLSSRLVNR